MILWLNWTHTDTNWEPIRLHCRKWGIHFDLADKSKKIEELEREREAPDFWNEAEVSQQKMKELKSYKDDVAVCAQLEEKLSDIETLIAMGDEENDVSLIPEIEEEIKEYEEAFEKIRIKTLLSGEYDKDNAIVSLHAGAGGTESCDWASMLYRMYTRWASDKGFANEVHDSLYGKEAGIKTITIKLNREKSYG